VWITSFTTALLRYIGNVLSFCADHSQREASLVPVVLVPGKTRIGLIGSGDALARRLAWLIEGGAEPVLLPQDRLSDIASLRHLFVAGLPLADATILAEQARASGVLVNVEDVPELCDFHVPATVRRGDLLLSISTGGKTPGLAKLIRAWLDRRFGPEWSYRVDHLGHRRSQWRAEGQSPSEISQRTREFVEERRWL
jgi:precorrin-2 dehydrogenase/sirohydrochlorin ferrochelatase